MKRTLRTLLLVSLGLVLAGFLALLVQYQLRPRLLIGQQVVVGFSKGTWIECLSANELTGEISEVRADGIVVKDKTGSFSDQNGLVGKRSGDPLCEQLGILVINNETKTYFVPFRNLGGFRKTETWFWSNPFPA